MEAEPKGLEASLQHLIQLHNHKSLMLAHHTEKAKKDAIRKAERVSDLLVEAVNGGVQDSFINQKRIELETRALASTITRFMKQTDQWLAATHTLNTALKVFSDLFAEDILTSQRRGIHKAVFSLEIGKLLVLMAGDSDGDTLLVKRLGINLRRKEG
ncbi:Biogenesis of lysosome-related organelles complex 1 subunit 1 [Sesbania bispinosa]|nr:Biogenesis of lysosome-related organelles complex 1 subunit 1 [Sesbania bispinosa]